MATESNRLNAFKTISMRIRGAKTELEEAGESTEGMAESTAKMRQEVMALSGVDIMLNKNTFKSTYQIMDELSEKWENLSDIAQASIIELMAGKHQGNVFASLMQNFDIAEKSLQTSLNSSGSAMKEHEKWMQSLEARINKLKATWQSLAQSFLSSNFLKSLLDGVIALVNGLDKLVSTFGTLPTILGGFAAFRTIFSNKGIFNFNKDTQSIQLFGNSLTNLKTNFGKISTAVNTYNSNLSKSTGLQNAYIGAIKNQNIGLGKYLSGLNGAKASMGGYVKSLIASKVATIGLRIVTTALNAALTMGISFLVSAGISALMKWINASEELAEQVEEVTSKFKEQHDALKKLQGDYDTSNESSMVSKYEKLSKGVDGLGRNVSLTSEEYSEYQSIVNSIAEQIPSLVSGYDEQGNALLSCKGNVEALTEAYEKLIHAQNNEILTNTGNIEKDFKNTLKDAEKGNFLGIGKKVSTPSIELLEKVLDGDYSAKEIENLLKDLNEGQEDGVYEALYNAGIGDMGRVYTTTEVAETLAKQLNEDKSKIKGIIDDYYNQFSDAVEEQKTIAQAVLSEAFDVSNAISGLNYGNISEELQTVANQVVSSLDYDFFAKLSENGKSVEQWTKEMLNQLNSISQADNAQIKAGFEFQTKFNGREISYGEYVKGLEDVGQFIANLDLDDDIKNQIKLSLGLDEDGLVKEYHNLFNRLTDSKNYDFNISSDEAKGILEGLTSEELPIFIDVITEMSNNNVYETAEQIQEALERELALKGLTIDLKIDVEKTKLEALTTAITESFSASGLSSESMSAVEGMFKSLDGYDPSKLFERTANGITLNTGELRKLNSEYKKTNLAKVNKELNSLGNIYNQTREELYGLTYGTDEYNSKAAELGNIEAQIQAAEKLASQYEGLASAYQEWQMVESAGSQRDMYENLIKGLKNIDDEISRGWYDDGTIEYLELLTGKDLSTAGIDEVKKAYKGLKKEIEHTSYSVRDFFTVDDDGNSTNTGVYNFLDAIGQMEEEKFGGKDVVQRDKKGNVIGFNFDLVGGDEVIAEALGVSEELVQIMVRAADDAGFVVSMDGTYQQLDTLKEKAQKASITLNDILEKQNKKGFSFNFNTSNVDDIKKQLREALNILSTFRNADGTINMELEGADEALTVASTLQSMLDKLTRPAYMEIEASQVEDELKEPLNNLQQLRKLTETEHQLKLSGADTSKLEESKQEIYTYFEELDPEVKAELGLVDDKGNPLTGDALKKKIESGDITIEATLDIQMEMDEKLGILVDKALLDAGIIKPEEFQKRVDIYLKGEVDSSDVEDKVDNAVQGESKEKSVVEKDVEINLNPLTNGVIALSETIGQYTDTEQKVVFKFLADPSQVETYKAEDKEAVVKFIADTLNVDGYTPEEKQAYAKYLVDGGNVDAYTPEEKNAIAKYLTDTEKVEEYTPEEKTAIAKFLADTLEVDAYTPEQKQAIAKFIKDSIEVDNYQMPTNKQAYAKYLKDTHDIDIWTPPLKEGGIAEYSPSIIDTTPPTLYGGKAWYTALIEGGGTVNGTANVNGTAGRAFKQGSWGTKDSGVALMGELGRETIVRDGRFFTVGDSGAGFYQYKKGDIIFNHKQTEELFKNGKVTSGGGRAKALVSGTAFAEGTAFSYGTGGAGKVSGNSVTSKKYEKSNDKNSKVSVNSVTGATYDKSSSSDDSNDSKEKFEETIDWVETAIDRIERSIDQLDQKANNVYESWSSRNKNLVDQISEVGNEIDLQQKAYDKYMAAANAVGLDKYTNKDGVSYDKLVREGAIDINTITDEALKEKIDDYRKYYEAALECKDKIEDLKETESELFAQRFENVQSQYDAILQGYEHTEKMLNEYISQAEEQGHIVSKKYYEALIANEKSNIAELKREQADLIKTRDEAVASGKLIKYSEEWYNMCNEIDGVTQAIEEGKTSLLSYANAMRDIDWSVFDLIQERISDVVDEADFLVELMSNDKLYEDNGKLTSQGLATMALHGQNYNTYMYQTDEYAKEVAEIDKQLANGYSKELEDRRRELIDLQRESILAADKEKDAIRDMVEEGINLELDALQERIDLYNEAMDSAKDLYDYQKKIEEQTSEIANLEKQRSAYLGDTSEEGRAKLQEIEVSLKEAKSDLEETEFDRYITQQEQLLDALYLEYETILNQRLDNVDALFASMISEADSNANLIKTTLETEANNVGTNLSTTMNNIWTTGDGSIKSVLTTYSGDFKNKSTTIITTLNGIKTGVNNMITALNKEATNKTTANKTSTSAKKNPLSSIEKSSGTIGKAVAKSTSSGDGKPKVGDKVKFVSGKYYYDSQGKKPLGSQNQGKYVYITNINTRSWATHPYHISTGKKLGSGDLGWLKLSQLSGYASGNRNFLEDEIAWTQEGNKREFIVRPSDGAILTPVAKGDSILNANASSNIWDMANNPAEFIKDNLNLGGANIPNNSNIQNNYTQHLDNVVFSFPNVKNYNELLSEMQKDKNFEKLILAMTVDQLAGKSSLAKNKAIR